MSAVTSDKFGRLIYSEPALCDLVMRGVDTDFAGFVVQDLDLEPAREWLITVPSLMQYHALDIPVTEFDQQQQSQWHMPESYQQLDIAQYVLNLCGTDQELQRCGQELLLYQERGLFDLLRYLKYLVDVMRENRIVWGVGRGSSVSSYVLYLIGVHRVDSIYYDLDIEEFLR
jgi:DNA polymerase III alpha subunit